MTEGLAYVITRTSTPESAYYAVFTLKSPSMFGHPAFINAFKTGNTGVLQPA